MKVLGIDPGTRHCGWGVVTREGTRVKHIAHGIIHLDADAELATRLVKLEADLDAIAREFVPSMASIETLFFAKDLQAASKLGHARGVALLVCARAGLSIYEFAPTLVKKAVAGSGRAEKIQVARMVRMLLGLAEVPPADAADALALAITCLQAAPWISQQKQRLKNALPPRPSKR